MADLLVLGYPDEASADRAYEVIQELQRDLIVEVAGAAVITKDLSGQTKMVTKTHATSAGALGGAFWGLLFGLIFFIPIAGLALGGLIGGLTGTLAGWGIRDDFRRRAADVLQPGKAALVLVLTKWTEDRTLARLSPLGGEVLKTSLSDEATKEIDASLAAHGQPTTPA
jgi:uncharacterized membrane protein